MSNSAGSVTAEELHRSILVAQQMFTSVAAGPSGTTTGIAGVWLRKRFP